MDKIICVGKNYLDHTKEMGGAIPEKPVLFLKPPSVLKQAQAWEKTLVASFPKDVGEVHHECEIVLKLARGGHKLKLEDVRDAVSAVTLGLDMTLRTRQAELKKNSHPWTTGKVFPDAAILAPWISIEEMPQYLDTEFSFSLDGKIRQKSVGRSMMMGIEEQLVYISSFFPLCEGDVVFTGTPAGVGPVQSGSEAVLEWANHRSFVKWE